MPAINLPKIPHTDFYIGSNKLEIVTTNTDAKTLEFTKTTTAKVQNLVTPEIGGFPKEIHPGIIEHDDHFEINGYMVSKENYKKPLCPKIEINYSQASPTIPQAWSEFFNGEILWFYNWEGAKVEAAYRGEWLPEMNELSEMLYSIPGDKYKKLSILNIPWSGIRGVDDKFLGVGDFGGLWSASPEINDICAQCIFLSTENFYGFGPYWEGRKCGFPVRSFLKKPEPAK